MAEYIEREAAVCIALGAAALGNTAFSDRFEIAARLRAIPAADVRPVVRGKWVRSGEIMYCNNCKYIAFNPHKFCPNCGADMREES